VLSVQWQINYKSKQNNKAHIKVIYIKRCHLLQHEPSSKFIESLYNLLNIRLLCLIAEVGSPPCGGATLCCSAYDV